MHQRSENYDARLAQLRRRLGEYRYELGKLTSDVEVTWQVTREFDHLICEAIYMGMTREEIHTEFDCLNTTVTLVVDTNPHGGYFKMSTNGQKPTWIQIDNLSLSLMSPSEYQRWLFDHGRTMGIKSIPTKAPPPPPRPVPPVDPDMIVTVDICPQTGLKSTTYTPRKRVA